MGVGVGEGKAVCGRRVRERQRKPTEMLIESLSFAFHSSTAITQNGGLATAAIAKKQGENAAPQRGMGKTTTKTYALKRLLGGLELQVEVVCAGALLRRLLALLVGVLGHRRQLRRQRRDDRGRHRCVRAGGQRGEGDCLVLVSFSQQFGSLPGGR